MRERRRPLDEMYTPEPNTGCWLFTGVVSWVGYGQLRRPREDGRIVTKVAHRVFYETLRGPIPDHLESDHLCNNKSCVNPDHIDLVTHAVNCQRREDRKRARSRP